MSKMSKSIKSSAREALFDKTDPNRRQNRKSKPNPLALTPRDKIDLPSIYFKKHSY